MDRERPENDRTISHIIAGDLQRRMGKRYKLEIGDNATLDIIPNGDIPNDQVIKDYKKAIKQIEESYIKLGFL